MPTGCERCRLLEEGQVLSFAQRPFELADDDRDFLFEQQLHSRHKNIAYDPRRHRLTGHAERQAGEGDRLCTIMREYSEQVTHFLADLLPAYAASWTVDYASYRPQEEEGRHLPTRARNDLLHTDAFPSRPTNGDRILRVFTNIHPSQPRRWVTSDTFDVLVQQFGGSLALPSPAPKSLRRWIVRTARAAGLPVPQRSPYDDFMLRFHDFLKANADFQATCRKTMWEFAPGTTWILFTDLVPHAALSGRYALEQTYIVSRHSLVAPEKAPLSILERRCGTRLTDGDSRA